MGTSLPKEEEFFIILQEGKKNKNKNQCLLYMCLVTGNFYVEVGWVTRHNTVHCMAVSRGQLEDSFLQAPGLI